MKNGIITLGEALIDFIPLDKDNITYQKSPGGAPANVAVGAARLGAKSTFIGKVGDDVLGKFLKETLTSYQVDTTNMLLTKDAKTGVVFVTLSESGERSFEFFITPSADVFLNENEIDETIFQKNKVFHFGSISLIDDPIRTATKKAVAIAKQNKMVVSYDPNLRLSLWKNEEVAKKTIISMINEADFLKISDEELFFITGEADLERGIAALDHYEVPVTVVTLGEKGCYVVIKGENVHVPSIEVTTIDTTGAGDAFVSGFLFCLNEYKGEIAELTLKEVEQMAKFASVSGGITASQKGAMTALPTIDQVKERIEKNK